MIANTSYMHCFFIQKQVGSVLSDIGTIARYSVRSSKQNKVAMNVVFDEELEYLILLFFIPEDILKRDNAIWMSPDGTKVVYATFNDTNVQQVRWKLYGGEDNNDDHLDPYPKEKFMRYPKVMKN